MNCRRPAGWEVYYSTDRAIISCDKSIQAHRSCEPCSCILPPQSFHFSDWFRVLDLCKRS